MAMMSRKQVEAIDLGRDVDLFEGHLPLNCTVVNGYSCLDNKFHTPASLSWYLFFPIRLATNFYESPRCYCNEVSLSS